VINELDQEAGDAFSVYYDLDIENKSGQATVSLLIQQVKYWFELKKTCANLTKAIRPKVIYLSTMDWCRKSIEIFGSPFGTTPYIGLNMSISHHRYTTGIGPKGRADWFYDLFFKRMLKNMYLQRILLIDEVAYGYCKSRYGINSKKVSYVPDFSSISGDRTKNQCRSTLCIPTSSFVLLVYGTLTNRKGIKELMSAFSNPDMPENVILHLAGASDADVRKLCDSDKAKFLKKKNRLITNFFFHDQDEEYRAFKSADAVWLGYTGKFFGSSGVLYQSISLGLPIIGMKVGLIGYYINKYRIGVSVDPYCCEDIVLKIKLLMSSKIDLVINQNKVEAFKKEHSPINFAKKVVAELL